MSRPRVLLADDHAIVVDGVKRILSSRFDVLEPVGDGRALVDQARTLKPDLIIADVTLPLLNGIEAIRQIRKFDDAVPVMVLTMHPELQYALQAVSAGANGYVLKHDAPFDLIHAADQVLSGRRYISKPLKGSVEDALAQRATGRTRSVSSDLSERQREVLQLVAEGRSAKEIGDILGISPRTADFHKRQLRAKLGFQTTAELVRYAVSMGLVSDNSE